MKLTRHEEALIARRRFRQARRAAAPKIRNSSERERDPAFLAWLRRLPCVACMVEGGFCGATEAAHIRFSDARLGRVNPGLQRKPSDRWATPLGRGHHQRDQHAGAERAFWERLRVDPGELAIALHADFKAGGDGLAVLRAFAG
jgi:hypothetical protein